MKKQKQNSCKKIEFEIMNCVEMFVLSFCVVEVLYIMVVSLVVFLSIKYSTYKSFGSKNCTCDDVPCHVSVSRIKYQFHHGVP